MASGKKNEAPVTPGTATWNGEKLVSRSGAEHLMSNRWRVPYQEAVCGFSMIPSRERQHEKVSECVYCAKEMESIRAREELSKRMGRA